MFLPRCMPHGSCTVAHHIVPGATAQHRVVRKESINFRGKNKSVTISPSRGGGGETCRVWVLSADFFQAGATRKREVPPR
jgi:hypothetical protein